MDGMTLYLAGQVHTVRNYRLWPNDVYSTILDRCRTLSDSPVRVEPDSGWVTAYEITEENNAPYADWPDTAPFKMADIASTQQATWATGVAFKQLWLTIRETGGNILWRENDKLYWVAVRVPLVSRDAPPPPAGATGSTGEATATPGS
ncbi:MAG: hypothetical protein KF726_05130 [Anaerolineae bacterium]|nr:hypothetical protein [Anaerolineae bacterium]